MIVGVWLLAACSSSSQGSPPSDSTSPPASTSVTPTPTLDTPVPTSTPTPSPVSTSPTTARPASTAPTLESVAPFTTTCRSLQVDVVKGGAIRGYEIAGLQFTNNGASACTIVGTPTAELLRNGDVIGESSRPNGKAVTAYTIQPGDYAESLLRDSSGCDAPLSDNLRLRLPAVSGKAGARVVQPIQLRACTLRASPVGEPS